MAFFECSLFSESLGMTSGVNVVLPQNTTGQIGLMGVASGEGCPVLYLLHGMSDDHTIWIRRTSVERYATQYGLALVMPNAHRSYYTDMVCGLKYWTYISEELPRLMQTFFKFSDRPEDTFVAGLSMGGYGALRNGLKYHDTFGAVAALSTANIVARMDGFTFIKNIRAQDAYKDIPIIVLSTEGQEKDIQTGMALGANLYMVKPAQPEKMVRNIKMLLG